MVLIWPLRQRLLQTAFMQQYPRWTGMRRIPLPPSLPWTFKDRPLNGMTSWGRYDRAPMAITPSVTRPSVTRPSVTRPSVTRPSVVHALKPVPATFFTIGGITRDSAGAVLGNCNVMLFLTSSNAFQEKTTSNADGYYYFKSPSRASSYYVVSYKAGAPDVSGTTLNTLTGV